VTARRREPSPWRVRKKDSDFCLLYWSTQPNLQSRLFLFIARKIVSLGYPEWWFETRFPGTALRLAFVTSTTHMKLYVGNLSFDTTENDLRTLFSDFGTVTDIYLVSDRATGNSRGFAFVTLSSASEGAAAINGLAGREFSGRSLTVNEARPKEDRPRRSFAGSRR
jgi:cold-inducible RNA-binding protein